MFNNAFYFLFDVVTFPFLCRTAPILFQLQVLSLHIIGHALLALAPGNQYSMWPTGNEFTSSGEGPMAPGHV